MRNKSSELADLQSQGDRLVIRSIFLQGLLVMSPEEVSLKFKGAKGSTKQALNRRALGE